MKTAWDRYLSQQLGRPAVRKAFEEETKVLNIGLQLASSASKKQIPAG